MFHLVFHCVTLMKGLETVDIDNRVMNKHVIAAILRSNETVSLTCTKKI